jgi:hypothetical protein
MQSGASSVWTKRGLRRVARVDYDTLQFVDAVFYRRRLARTEIIYWANGDSTASSGNQTGFGRHDQISGGVVLHPYHRLDGGIPHNTLWSTGGELVRLRRLNPGTREERYVRR